MTSDSELIRPFSEIAFIAVSASARGQGVGTMLISSATEAARKRDQDLIVKTASQSARTFYKRCGFTKVGEEHRCKRSLTMLLRKCGGHDSTDPTAPEAFA